MVSIPPKYADPPSESSSLLQLLFAQNLAFVLSLISQIATVDSILYCPFAVDVARSAVIYAGFFEMYFVFRYPTTRDGYTYRHVQCEVLFLIVHFVSQTALIMEVRHIAGIAPVSNSYFIGFLCAIQPSMHDRIDVVLCTLFNAIKSHILTTSQSGTLWRRL